MLRRLLLVLSVIVPVTAATATATTSGARAAPDPSGAASPSPDAKNVLPANYTVYWDQNEEQDLLSPTGQVGQLIHPWDPNGQMCIFRDGSGRFVTGYNPTIDPTNGGFSKPKMQPPVGEAVWDSHGNFTGQTIYVPGPFKLPGQTVGGDIPPDANRGTFNGNGTMTGCVFDHDDNLFASDLGTAQGQFPPPHTGRLIEWFGPTYQTYCIVAGPTAGGVGPHHVDGTGGLSQPGMLSLDRTGNILLPEADPNGGLNGRVLRLWHYSLPHSAADCAPDGNYPPSKLKTSVFVQGSPSLLPFPQSVAYDRLCRCFAVASVIGDPAIAWFDNNGNPVASMGEFPGESVTQVGMPGGYNPFGMAFAPDGTLYFADIHIRCSAPLTNCGPAGDGGQIMKVAFSNGHPDPPVPIASGYNFPTSVTICHTNRASPLGGPCPEP